MPSGSSSSSSLAFLSSQLEETRVNQMKERSKRTLELMKAAVQWKSWEELRTLTKAFQVYLEEVREMDQRRKRDLETSISRVWAVRHQLAKADRHKDEAIAQAELLSTGNDGLRHQLEFDARQFVALLQSCAHLERQLAELRQRCTEQDFELGRSATAEAEAVPSASTSCCLDGATSTAWEAASSSRSKGVSVADLGVKTVTAGCTGDNLQVPRGDTHKQLVPCADAGIEALLLGKSFKGLSEEIARDKGIRETVEDPPNAEAVAEGAQGASVAAEPMAAQDEEGLEGQSPYGTTHLSETSTVVALSPSDSWNSPSRDARRLEALRVLFALADLKKRLQLCSARDTSISTTDGTPGLTSPDAHVEDPEEVSAVDTGTSQSSVVHSPVATLGESLCGAHGKVALGPRAICPSQSRSEEQTERDQESPRSPFQRPSILAAEEASRFASMKTQAEAAATREEESCSKLETSSRPSTRHTVRFASQLARQDNHRPSDEAPLSARRFVTDAAGFAVQKQQNYRQSVPGPMAASAAYAFTGYPSRSTGTAISSPHSCLRTPERKPSSGLSAPPVVQVPGRPADAPEQRRSCPPACRQTPKAGHNGKVERQPDASYVATIKLVEELNNRKVPNSSSCSGPKEASSQAESRASRREKPMTRDIDGSPRQRRSSREEQSTKASL